MTHEAARFLPDPHQANELLPDSGEHLPFEDKLGHASETPDFEHMAEHHYPLGNPVPDTVEGTLSRVAADRRLMKPWKDFMAQGNSSEERRVIGPSKLHNN